MDALNIVSLLVGIIGLFYAFYTTNQFTRGVKNSSLQSIRTLINRMEEEKSKQQENSPQWTAMHHTQQDLDSLFKSLQKMFSVSDKNAPLS